MPDLTADERMDATVDRIGVMIAANCVKLEEIRRVALIPRIVAGALIVVAEAILIWLLWP